MSKNRYLEEESDEDDENEVDIHGITATGTIEEIKWALQKDRLKLCNLKEKQFGRVPIHTAVDKGRLDMAKALLVFGSDPNARDLDEATPLHLAASHGHCDIIAHLMGLFKIKCDIKLRDIKCWGPLHYACFNNKYDASSLLIEYGCNLNDEEFKHGKTPLHFCAEMGFHELADLLIIRGANITASGDKCYSKTPLHLACEKNHIECVRVLCNRDANCNALSGLLDQSPLHIASEKGFVEIVEILLNHKAMPNLTGEHVYGLTALHAACLKGHLDCVKLLTKFGADLTMNARYSYRGAALHMACQGNHYEIVEHLIANGCHIDYRDNLLNAPIHVACEYQNFNIAVFLISKNCTLDFKNSNGKLPFDYATLPLDREKFRNAADAAAAERARLMALAIKAAEEEKVRKFIEEEAERKRQFVLAEQNRVRESKRGKFKSILAFIADVNGDASALSDIIIEFPEQNINDMLTFESDLLNKIAYESTALARCSRRGFIDIVDQLCDWPNIDLDAQDTNGNTALHLAAMYGHRDVVEILLSRGCKTGISNKDGKTPAQLGVSSFICEIIRNPTIVANRYSTDMKILETEGRIVSSVVGKPSLNNLQIENSNFIENLDTAYQNIPYAVANRVVDNSVVDPIRIIEPQKSKNTLNTEMYSEVTESFTQGMFGAIPASYAGNREDMMFGEVRTEHQIYHSRSLEIYAKSQRDKILDDPDQKHGFLAAKPVGRKTIILPPQAYHVPSLIDSTEQWLDVKDYLWLFGYIYKPKRVTLYNGAVEVDASTVSSNNSNSPVAQYVSTQYHIDKGEYAEIPDKRFAFYQIACVMNEMHSIFTNPISLDVTVMLSEAPGQDGAFTSHATFYSRKLAKACSDFVKLFVNIFEPETGWPLKWTGHDSDIWERISLLAYGQMINEETKIAIFKLLQFGGFQCEKNESFDFNETGVNEISRGDTSIINARYRRVIIDTVYEIGCDLKRRTERIYQLDSVRAHFWLRCGKTHIKRNKEYKAKADAENNIDYYSFHIWISDLKLQVYEKSFLDIGFKVITDFQDLSYADCQDYFPFLKVGDLRRLAKSISLLNVDTIDGYKRRAQDKQVAVPLPPLPGLLPAVGGFNIATSPRLSSGNKIVINGTSFAVSSRQLEPKDESLKIKHIGKPRMNSKETLVDFSLPPINDK